MPLQAFGNFDSISAFTLAVGLSSIQGLTGLPGQVGVFVRYVSGGTLQIGGASLTWGSAGIASSSGNFGHEFPCSGTIYFASTGATTIVSGFRYISNASDAG
jgi:hypothetical protein